MSISLMNLVTAVMVEGSLSQAQSDKDYMKKIEEKQKTKLLPEIQTMFENMDDDGSNEEMWAGVRQWAVAVRDQASARGGQPSISHLANPTPRGSRREANFHTDTTKLFHIDTTILF